LKNLLIRTKFYWSWGRGPVLIVRTDKGQLYDNLTASDNINNRINLNTQ